MRFDFITLFPEMFSAFFQLGVCGRAVVDQKASVHFWNPRDYATPPHHHVDDRPYGGGCGMVLLPGPVVKAADAAKQSNPTAHPIYLTPRGSVFNDRIARRLAQQNGLIFLCGRYRGIDERAVKLFAGEEISVGDYILSGGETAALTVIDALLRYVPGVLGNTESTEEEAFADGRLDAPCYTRPSQFAGMTVPDVLLSGNHSAIANWRQQQAEQLTATRRPDLVNQPTHPKNQAKPVK